MIKLGDIAHGRSGDKGCHANIGIIAYTAAGYAFLEKELTSERVVAYLHSMKLEKVERFSLPKLRAFNFLLHGVLAPGAFNSLRTDSRGKVLATALLEMEIPAPADRSNLFLPKFQAASRGL